MSALIFFIAFTIGPMVGQTSKTTSLVDLSGSWRDDRGRTWTISQSELQITIEDSGGTKIRGAIDGHIIKYTDQTILGEASSQACQPYVGQTFEFASKFKISKNATKIERKAPESVTKGQCRLSLKKIPAFALTKVSGK